MVAADIASCREGWNLALGYFSNPDYAFVLLDELNIVLAYDYLPKEEVLAALNAKRDDQHIVITGRGAQPELIELADLAPELFDWSSEAVSAAADRLRAARLAVIASPTFKGTYTGLLKAFLDRFARTDLNGVTVVPVLVGSGPAHALAVEVHLRPLLVEIGASLPTRGLFVLDTELDQLDATVDTWLSEAATPLSRALAP